MEVEAGTGFFTARVVDALKRLGVEATMYALDASPAMLRALVERLLSVTSILGAAEDIRGSLAYARRFIDVPDEFNAVLHPAATSLPGGGAGL